MPDGLPPALGGAPSMGASPMAVPTGNAGQIANAKSQIRAAYDILVKALPSFQLGTDDHKALLQVMQSLGKIAPVSAEVPGVQQTTANNLAADANRNALMQMLRGRQGAPAGAAAGGGAGIGASSAAPPSPAMPPSLAA